MPEYYLFLYFEKNDKPLTLRELQEGVMKDFGWLDYRVSHEHVYVVVERLSSWFAMDGYEISFVGKRDEMFELYVRLSKRYLSNWKWREKPQTYHYPG